MNPGASPPIPQPTLPAASARFVSFYAELPASGWSWTYTSMYINLNHEVAPREQALGCASRHPSLGGDPATSCIKDLYDLVGCGDPAANPACKKR